MREHVHNFSSVVAACLVIAYEELARKSVHVDVKVMDGWMGWGWGNRERSVVGWFIYHRNIGIILIWT